MKPKQQHRSVILFTCMVVLLASAISGVALAKELYSWTDENGVVHYGDLPPDGQEVQIVKDRASSHPGTSGTEPKPGGTQPDAASDAIVEEDAEGSEDSPPQSFADARREKIASNRKERREARAEMDRTCAKHRERLANVEPRRRITYQDESGESVRMDDDKRIALVEESRDFLAKNCD